MRSYLVNKSATRRTFCRIVSYNETDVKKNYDVNKSINIIYKNRKVKFTNYINTVFWKENS